MTGSSTITLFVNGRKIVLNEKTIDPRYTLLQFLRKSGLTGAKLGCGEGGCGACTVMLSSYDAENGRPVHYSANACLTPVCALDGIAVTTVEGIGNMKDGLHPVQQRITAMHGSQCGFCTPGIVMAIYTHLRANPNATPHEIESSLDGNLCRCTGYRPILDAARSLSNNKGGAASGGCCKGKGGEGGCPCAETLKAAETPIDTFKYSTSEDVIQANPGLQEALHSRNLSEPIFPPELTRYKHQSLAFEHDGARWFQPVTLDELLSIKAAHPEAKIIAGNTEVGIEMRLKAMEYTTFANPTHVPELRATRVTDSGIEVGAAVTINGFRTFIEQVETQLGAAGKAYQVRGLTAIRHMLTWFASNHIRNVAAIGGNIATASPISDLNPMLLALNAVLRIASKSRGTREMSIRQFFLAYRKVALEADEVLVSVLVPFTEKFEYVLPFKQARRREDDVSIVTAGLRVHLEPNGTEDWVVRDASMAFGGMAPTTILAPETAAALVGKAWSYAAVEGVFPTLRSELSLPVTVPGGQSEYRTALTVSFLFKAFLTMTAQHGAFVAEQADASTLPAVPAVNPSDMSATFNFLTQEKTYSRGEQGFFDRQGAGLHKPYTNENKHAFPAQNEPTGATPEGGVGQSLTHRNSAAQVTGITKYVDDMPLPSNAVHACLVTATRAHARLLSVDVSEAEKFPGFVAYFSAKDVTGSNHMGAIVHDEEVFVTEEVLHYGAVIGVILADTHEQAVLAARRVKVQYEDLPAIISIDDAIAAQSFFPARHVLESGDLARERDAAEVHVQGRGRIGGQEHFYLETNATIALPTEQGHMEIYSSTQNIAETQKFCSSVCGLPASKVVVKCKRMGGGFGGKESRSVFIACAATLAAHLLDRPVSINIERDVDMSITGQRHAFQYDYKAGMNKDGSLRYLEVDLYSNAGFSHDLSVPVMDRALFHVDNVYRWPALTARGNVCKTNQPTHTAYRGFGGPQGMVVTETVMQHLSEVSGVPLEVLKGQNMYREGDRTHFDQPLECFYVPDLWEKTMRLAEVEKRKAEVAAFNKDNRWRKRGLAIIPTKFGINFTAKFMNQGGALVHVYTDGSVLVAHGGTEMGQGLFTKVIQVAASCFGIPESFIVTTESATNTVPNASPSAASLSSDLYGMAVLDACEKIKARLAPLRERMPDAEWPTLVRTAYFERIDLSAHGFYIINTERCGFDWDKKCTRNSERGFPFNYFTMGVACTEVEIDCLTGDSHVLRADVLMDVGKSINPAIDIGQIEGAWIQGYGWSTMEELIWGDKEHTWVRPGQLFTRGPGTYKIPSFNDVPADFRVHLSDTDNRFAIHSSKAVGEPPFFMGASALFAIKDAVNAARRDNGFTEYYPLNLPATSERIRMACTDNIAKLCISPADDGRGPEQFQPFASC